MGKCDKCELYKEQNNYLKDLINRLLRIVEPIQASQQITDGIKAEINDENLVGGD